jgi:hypothetical protein
MGSQPTHPAPGSGEPEGDELELGLARVALERLEEGGSDTKSVVVGKNSQAAMFAALQAQVARDDPVSSVRCARNRRPSGD